MSAALLLAQPEPESRTYLERHLTADGFDVVGAAEGRRALDLAEAAKPDLVVLSAALPDACGLELCRRLREGEPGRSWDRRVPVILLGDESHDVRDRVRAFERGADDYLPKPFAYDELLARIRAVLRRVAPAEPDRMQVEEISIDRPARRVTVNAVPVTLPSKEYELLCKLASDPKRIFTKEQLLREVWGFRSLCRTRTLDSHASRLRRKLAAAGAGREYVVNQWGVGYRLVGD